MKRLFCGMLVYSLILVLYGCGGAPSDQGKERLRVGYHPNFGGASAVSIGLEKGYFAQEGLEVELVQFTSGPPSVAALVAGDIDISFLGHGAFSLVLEGQVDVIAVDCLSNAEEILARTDSGIRTVEDLKDRTLACSYGTSGENFLDMVLDYNKLFRDDINVVNMDVAGTVSALVRGQVEAVSLWVPYTNEIREQLGSEGIVVVADCVELRDVMALPMCWVSTDKYIDGHQDTVLLFVRALYRCLNDRARNPEEAVALVAERLDMRYDDLWPDIKTAEWFTSESVYGYLMDGSVEKWYQEQQEFFLRKGAINQTVPIESYLRLDFMREVLEHMENQ